MHVSISSGNSKMGELHSVSLPPGETCRSNCECKIKCYARRICARRPNVREAYKRNYEIYRNDPELYWREVEASIMMSRFFRFHVAGDIPDPKYLQRMTEIAERNPHCEILCFTKKYNMVNSWISGNGYFPANLHIIMSAWRGLTMNNPYGLPEAHVRYRDGTTTAAPGAQKCGGNCTECAISDGGCWAMSLHDQIVFDEH